MRFDAIYRCGLRQIDQKIRSFVAKFRGGFLAKFQGGSVAKFQGGFAAKFQILSQSFKKILMLKNVWVSDKLRRRAKHFMAMCNLSSVWSNTEKHLP